MAKTDLEFGEPSLWACPRCAAAFVTPELLPRCGKCGFREGP